MLVGLADATPPAGKSLPCSDSCPGGGTSREGCACGACIGDAVARGPSHDYTGGGGGGGGDLEAAAVEEIGTGAGLAVPPPAPPPTPHPVYGSPKGKSFGGGGGGMLVEALRPLISGNARTWLVVSVGEDGKGGSGAAWRALDVAHRATDIATTCIRLR